jgi:hypothetical protein
MTTFTLKIDENSEKGKALLAFLKAFNIDKEQKDVELVEEPESPYNPEFVSKIQKARKEEGIELLPNQDIWEIIE